MLDTIKGSRCVPYTTPEMGFEDVLGRWRLTGDGTMGFFYFKFKIMSSFCMLTEGILKLKGMKQSLSFLVVLTFVDKLMVSCANNCGSANLIWVLFKAKKKKKKSINMNPSQGH